MMGGDAALVLQRNQEFVTSLDDLLARMQSMFYEMVNKTIAIIESCKSSLQAEINVLREKIQLFQERSRAEIATVTNSVDKVKNKVCSMAGRTAAMERSKDLLLFGVPFHPSENLPGVLETVCSVLGYSGRNVPLAFIKRLARAPMKTGGTPPILLQFAFKSERNDFFRRYLAARNLSLQHLGLATKTRIYLSENLTKLGRTIKGAALKLKHDGKIHSVFTYDGIVYTKAAADAKPNPIFALDQLPT